MLKFFIRTSGNFLFILGLGIFTFTYIPIFYSNAYYTFSHLNANDKLGNISEQNDEKSLSRSNLNSPNFENIIAIEPVDDEFSIIINKIDVNVPVVPDVATSIESEYMQALKYGVAHARGTPYPGEIGNSFYFAHSSLNFWQLGPYATVFNLLNKLEKGDTITLYYDGNPYLYRVFETDVVNGWNTEPFEVEYEEPVATFITCDPPGSTINRRVVKAKLIRTSVSE